MPKVERAGVSILTIENPVECLVQRRINRFVVEVRVKEGLRRAHINNTGRLHELLVKGRKGFCIRNPRPGKTDLRLFSIREGDLGIIIDTRLQMKAFEESLAMGLVSWLEGCRILRRNARLGDSLIDYLLECGGEEVYLEVKSAALREGEYATYPDCPSLRGRKHIGEVTSLARDKGRAILLFVAALPAVKAFRPNRPGDPALCELLTEAQREGVEMRAMGIYYSPSDSSIRLFDPDLEVVLL